DTFLAFLRDVGLAEPKPMLCELSYINHVPHGDAWRTVDDIAGVFKDFRWASGKEIFPVPRSLSWSCGIDLPQNAGTLTARLSQVTRVGDPVQSLRVDLVCKGIG